METEFFADLFEQNEEINSPILTEEEADAENEREISVAVRDNIETLLTNGKLTATVSVAGHEFVIKTLTIGEELAVAEVCKPYSDSLAQARALATATVAAALETIDGKPLMQNLGPDHTVAIRQRFNYLKNNWYWNIVGHIYQEYLVLLQQQVVAFEELRGK